MEQQGREMDSWEVIVEKAVDAKAKASLLPAFLLREVDQQVPRGNQPTHTTTAKAYTQGSFMKNPRMKEPKAKTQKSKAPPPQRSKNPKASEKARKDKKKDRRNRGRGRRPQKGSTPATGINSTSSFGGNARN